MWLNTLLLALREIRRNLLRSFLTMLGIVIGVGAVITMVTLGNGATRAVQSQIASLGSNLLMIMLGQQGGPAQSTVTPFKIADADAIAWEIAGVVAVAPISSKSVTAIAGNTSWTTQVTGSTNALFTVRSWPFTAGRPFTDAEVRAGSAVCVIGATVRTKLFGDNDPVGGKIRLQNLSCQVIGVLTAKGQAAMGPDQDDVVVLPIRALQRRVTGNDNVSLIQVSVQDGVSTSAVASDIIRLM